MTKKMMTRALLLPSFFALATACLPAQNLDPALILKALPTVWPTYSGDYTGQRYSKLNQINQQNVRQLSLAWSSRVVTGSRGAGGAPPVNIGGEGAVESNAAANIRGARACMWISPSGLCGRAVLARSVVLPRR